MLDIQLTPPKGVAWWFNHLGATNNRVVRNILGAGSDTIERLLTNQLTISKPFQSKLNALFGMAPDSEFWIKTQLKEREYLNKYGGMVVVHKKVGFNPITKAIKVKY